MAEETFCFDRVEDIVRLSWFELDNGSVVVADKTVGPIIDMHAHYAAPMIWPHRTNHDHEPTITELLLPCCARHDLDVYANQNFDKLGLKLLKRKLVLGGFTGGGSRHTHTAPNLARDAAAMGVIHSAVLAIDMGWPSHTVRDTIAVAGKRNDTTAFGSVHPRRRRPKERFEEQLHAGVRGLKLHPQLQQFHPDAPEAMKVYELCGREQTPVIWHCGPVGIELKSALPYVQVPNYERPIKEHPDTTFLLGHAGALQCDQAIALQRRYKNVYLEVSSISLSQMRMVVEEADPDRIVFGTDWPFYHHALQLAKVLVVTEGKPGLRRKVLHDNAARLLRL